MKELESLMLFLVSLPVGYCALIIHEFGHALAAYLCGFKLKALVVGSRPRLLYLRPRLRNGKLGTRFIFGLNFLRGAYCRISKDSGNLESRLRLAIVVLAGGLANFLAAATCLLFVGHAKLFELFGVLVEKSPLGLQKLVGATVLLFVLINALASIQTIPFLGSGDGAALWRLLRKKNRRASLAAGPFNLVQTNPHF